MEGTIKKAAKDLKPGDQVVEHDGALLTIATVRHWPLDAEIVFERYGSGPAVRVTWAHVRMVRVMADVS